MPKPHNIFKRRNTLILTDFEKQELTTRQPDNDNTKQGHYVVIAVKNATPISLRSVIENHVPSKCINKVIKKKDFTERLYTSLYSNS